MNGSGCKNCPVNHCETMNYRGSTCAAQRAKFGLGDPKTNADRIRAMTDEELEKFIPDWSYTNACKCGEKPYVACNNECEKCVSEWLQQPAEDL